MNHKPIIDQINRYFSDTSRTPAETLQGLREVQAEIDMLVETLEAEADE